MYCDNFENGYCQSVACCFGHAFQCHDLRGFECDSDCIWRNFLFVEQWFHQYEHHRFSCFHYDIYCYSYECQRLHCDCFGNGDCFSEFDGYDFSGNNFYLQRCQCNVDCKRWYNLFMEHGCNNSEHHGESFCQHDLYCDGY